MTQEQKSLYSSATHRRRVCIWAAVVTAIVAVLSFQAALPDYQLLPSLPGGLGAATILALFVAALCCEFIDSGLGMGYGTTLTPMLLLAGFSPLQIVPCVLLSEFVTGLTASVMHHRDGNVDFFGDKQARLTAMLLSILSVVGTVAAVTLALRIPEFWLKGIIAIIILSVGIATLATVRRRFRYRRGHIIALGAVAAFNKGLSGGGYGPLVTAGQVVSGISPKNAVAITSLAESLTCLVGLVAYMIMAPHKIEWALAAPLTVGAMLSVPMATLTVKQMPEALMRVSVGTVTCLLGVLTVAKLFW
ncbi:MAG: sulfite exporter TauE/SafE family protein [Planctomycetota bacterium]|nr:sulfite exporter TauE/SafE family protein [Planctomycetota bacterium]MEA3341756.1 sulfite exporter TauE/SafE family protein [Chloroflexota bacterium]